MERSRYFGFSKGKQPGARAGGPSGTLGCRLASACLGSALSAQCPVNVRTPMVHVGGHCHVWHATASASQGGQHCHPAVTDLSVLHPLSFLATPPLRDP